MEQRERGRESEINIRQQQKKKRKKEEKRGCMKSAEERPVCADQRRGMRREGG
jgi:hypothetical protein